MDICKLARESLRHYLKYGRPLEPDREVGEVAGQRNGVFVCFKKNGQLRGCIGTFQCTTGSTTAEVAANAVKAGTQDWRFTPVRLEEVDELSVTVDVLQPPERVFSLEDLDCRRYGVIVQCGQRSGTLLPDLEGVDSVGQQVAIAMQKAGIGRDETVTLYRYAVDRYSEGKPGPGKEEC
ncbi:MAG: AmmeMemoRadiSam system protein A [Negativicutes bacterium]|nr:AmmeMemoRadiSam system protein A [Negativicutes bacterium]